MSDELTPDREAWNAAGRIAQAAHSLVDLAALVQSHPDPRVRYQAMPRLRARFPYERQTLEVLLAAAEDAEPMVREAAVSALGDLGDGEAADAVAKRLHDDDFDVRLGAGQTLAFLGDDRAPADPETWALSGMLKAPSVE